jgi:endonuclease YncB( thermonuclease family)
MIDEPSWIVRATVVRIVDGDTFVADLDLGWGVWRRETIGAPCRVRVLGYNTPEKGQPGWTEATNLLGLVLPPGTIVWVHSKKLDSFGRALCDVYLKDGTNVLDHLNLEWKI